MENLLPPSLLPCLPLRFDVVISHQRDSFIRRRDVVDDKVEEAGGRNYTLKYTAGRLDSGKAVLLLTRGGHISKLDLHD